MAEIATRTDRSRESVRLLITGDRGPGRVPAPATHLKSRQRMWCWQDVVTWFAEVLGEDHTAGDPGDARFITASTPAWNGAESTVSYVTRSAAAYGGSFG